MLVDRNMSKLARAFDKWGQNGRINVLEKRLEREKKSGKVIMIGGAAEKNQRKDFNEALALFLRNAKICNKFFFNIFSLINI